MEIKERVLTLIENRFGSDAEFERTANLKEKTVYDWKRGKSESYLKIIPNLCKLFNVTSDYLYFGTTQAGDITLTDFQIAVLEETADINDDAVQEKFLQNAKHFKDLISKK